MTREQTAIETLQAGGYFSHKLSDGYHGPKFRVFLYDGNHRVVRGIGAATLDKVRASLRSETQGNCVSETRYYWRTEQAPVQTPIVPVPVAPSRKFVVEILGLDGCLIRIATDEETDEFWSLQSEKVRASKFRQILSQNVRLSNGTIGQPSTRDV